MAVAAEVHKHRRSMNGVRRALLAAGARGSPQDIADACLCELVA